MSSDRFRILKSRVVGTHIIICNFIKVFWLEFYILIKNIITIKSIRSLSTTDINKYVFCSSHLVSHVPCPMSNVRNTHVVGFSLLVPFHPRHTGSPVATINTWERWEKSGCNQQRYSLRCMYLLGTLGSWFISRASESHLDQLWDITWICNGWLTSYKKCKKL